MKIAKLVLAVALIATSVDFAEAAPVTEASANTATTLQLPPPPPPPGLPRFGRRHRYVRHRRYVRRGSGLHIHLPPPPPRPPLP